MSKNTKIADNYYRDWLNGTIYEEHIKSYNYSDFKNIQQIGKGSFGSVNRANYRNEDRFFALKSFNDDNQTLKEVVKEVPYRTLIHNVSHPLCFMTHKMFIFSKECIILNILT